MSLRRTLILGFGLTVMTLVSVRALARQPETPPPLPSVALPADLERVLHDYERAWQAHDAEALSDLFAEDGFVMSGGKPPVRGRAAIRAAYAAAGGPLSLRALAYSTSGNVGYIIGGFGRAAGTPDTGKFVLTLKRGDSGRWLIMPDMDNSNQQRPGPGLSPSASPVPMRPSSLTPVPSRGSAS